MFQELAAWGRPSSAPGGGGAAGRDELGIALIGQPCCPSLKLYSDTLPSRQNKMRVS